MTEPYLAIENLNVVFRTDSGLVRAVNDISYAIRSGESVGIVGESGSGKSVSMLAVMRLLKEPPAQVTGHIWYKGKDLLAMRQSKMRSLRGNQIAMIFQDPMTALNPVLTIERQMTEPLQTHLGLKRKDARRRAVELLDLVGIASPARRLDDYPHEFSGGMRQRVMIAMALSCNPDFLIADEPTTALDVTIQAQIVNLMKQLRDEIDMALVWITHDLGIVAGLVERVLVMYAGQVVEQAPVDDLYRNPQHPYTLGLLRSVPRMNGGNNDRLQAIAGSPPDLSQLPAGCSFAPRCAFVQDICHRQRPPLMTVSSAHSVACWVNVAQGVVDESRAELYKSKERG